MLLSVLILAVVGVTISTTLLMLSISGAQTAGTLEESQEARAAANACAEKGLQQLVSLSTYLGSGSLMVGSNTCKWSVATNDSSSDKIFASSTVGQTTRKLLAKITVPGLVMMTWQDN